MKCFVEHPSEVGETYWQHMRYALKMSCRLALYSLHLVASASVFVVHAILPCIPVCDSLNLRAQGARGKKFLEEAEIREQEQRRGS